MKLPSLSLITNHNRSIARAVMLLATLFFGWRMASLLWLLAGQDQAALAKPTEIPGCRLGKFLERDAAQTSDRFGNMADESRFRSRRG